MGSEGIVCDDKHLIFVSWNQQGVLFEKSPLNAPSASHTAVLAVRSTIEAHTSERGETKHHLQQTATVINFLPDSPDAIFRHVRLFPAALVDRAGVPATNWQSLELLFKPEQFLQTLPLVVSASMPIKVSDALYKAAVQRAYTLEALQTKYFVLGTPKIAVGTNVENCLSAVSGISRFACNNPQNAVEPIQTGTLRGRAGTDHIARELLKRFSIAPSGDGTYGNHDDRWVVQALFHSEAPARNAAVKWYFLAPLP